MYAATEVLERVAKVDKSRLCRLEPVTWQASTTVGELALIDKELKWAREADIY